MRSCLILISLCLFLFACDKQEPKKAEQAQNESVDRAPASYLNVLGSPYPIYAGAGSMLFNRPEGTYFNDPISGLPQPSCYPQYSPLMGGPSSSLNWDNGVFSTTNGAGFSCFPMEGGMQVQQLSNGLLGGIFDIADIWRKPSKFSDRVKDRKRRSRDRDRDRDSDSTVAVNFPLPSGGNGKSTNTPDDLKEEMDLCKERCKEKGAKCIIEDGKVHCVKDGKKIFTIDDIGNDSDAGADSSDGSDDKCKKVGDNEYDCPPKTSGDYCDPNPCPSNQECVPKHVNDDPNQPCIGYTCEQPSGSGGPGSGGPGSGGPGSGGPGSGGPGSGGPGSGGPGSGGPGSGGPGSGGPGSGGPGAGTDTNTGANSCQPRDISDNSVEGEFCAHCSTQVNRSSYTLDITPVQFENEEVCKQQERPILFTDKEADRKLPNDDLFKCIAKSQNKNSPHYPNFDYRVCCDGKVDSTARPCRNKAYAIKVYETFKAAAQCTGANPNDMFTIMNHESRFRIGVVGSDKKSLGISQIAATLRSGKAGGYLGDLQLNLKNLTSGDAYVHLSDAFSTLNNCGRFNEYLTPSKLRSFASQSQKGCQLVNHNSNPELNTILGMLSSRAASSFIDTYLSGKGLQDPQCKSSILKLNATQKNSIKKHLKIAAYHWGPGRAAETLCSYLIGKDVNALSSDAFEPNFKTKGNFWNYVFTAGGTEDAAALETRINEVTDGEDACKKNSDFPLESCLQRTYLFKALRDQKAVEEGKSCGIQ